MKILILGGIAWVFSPISPVHLNKSQKCNFFHCSRPHWPTRSPICTCTAPRASRARTGIHRAVVLLFFLTVSEGLALAVCRRPAANRTFFFCQSQSWALQKTFFAYRETNSAVSMFLLLVYECSYLDMLPNLFSGSRNFLLVSGGGMCAIQLSSHRIYPMFVFVRSFWFFLIVSAVFQEHQLGPLYMFARLLLG